MYVCGHTLVRRGMRMSSSKAQAAEMAQQLRLYTALVEDSVSFPVSLDFSSRGSESLFWPLQLPAFMDRQRDTHTHTN